MWKIKQMLVGRGYWEEASGELPDAGAGGGGDSGGWTPPASFTEQDTEIVSKGLEVMDDVFGGDVSDPPPDEKTAPAPDTPADEPPSDPPPEAPVDPRTEEERKADEEGIHPPSADINVMPKSWKAGLAQEFAALPETVKAEIHRREENFFRGIERLKPAVNFALEIDQSLRPFAEQLKAAQATPKQAIEYLFSAHHVLTRGTPEERAQAIRHFAQEAGVDLHALVSGLPAASEPAYEDPAVADLRKQVGELKSQLTTAEQRKLDEARASAEREFNEFAAKNPDVNKVLDDMIPLIRSGLSLQAAYDKAIWANPVTRAEKLKAEADAKAEAERKKAVEKAQKAKQASSARVREPSRGGSPTAPLGDLDATLKEVYANIAKK